VEVMSNELVRMDFYMKAQRYLLKTSLSPTIYVVDNSIAENLSNLADEVVVPPPPEPEPVAPTFTAPAPLPVTEKPIVTIPQPQPAAKDTEITPEAQQVLMSLAIQSSDANQVNEPEPGELIVYTVKRGETLDSIAKKFQATKEKLMRWNLLKTEAIKPGLDIYVFTTVKVK